MHGRVDAAEEGERRTGQREPAEIRAQAHRGRRHHRAQAGDDADQQRKEIERRSRLIHGRHRLHAGGPPAVIPTNPRRQYVYSPVMLNDLRYGLRMLLHTKAWTAIVVISLALGIGANTAIFSAVNGLLLAEVPARDPGSLVRLRWAGRNQMSTNQREYGNSATDAAGRSVRATFSYPMYQQLRADNQTMSDLAALAPGGRVNVVVDGRAEIATAFVSSGNYYQLLGANAMHGRTIVPDDDRADAPPVAVIGESTGAHASAAIRQQSGRSFVPTMCRSPLSACCRRRSRASNAPSTRPRIFRSRYHSILRSPSVSRAWSSRRSGGCRSSAGSSPARRRHKCRAILRACFRRRRVPASNRTSPASARRRARARTIPIAPRCRTSSSTRRGAASTTPIPPTCAPSAFSVEWSRWCC